MEGQGRDFSYQSGEITGQAQMKRDEILNQASHASRGENAQSGQNTSYDNIKGQATNFLQQTGEQVKNMAAGAADAVKHTLGMDTDNNNNNNNNNRSNPGGNPAGNPANRSGTTNHPSNPSTMSNPSNPSTMSNISNPSTRI